MAMSDDTTSPTYGRRKGDMERETLDHRKIALLTTIRALCVVIIVVMSILGVVLGYTLSSVNSANTKTETVTRVVCGVLDSAPIELPSDCIGHLPETTTTTATVPNKTP